MAKVLVLDASGREWVDLIDVRTPPGKERTTVGVIFLMIVKAVARLGHELHSLDLAEWVRDTGFAVKEDVDYVAWVDPDVRAPWIPPGLKEWRPE